MDAQKVDFFMMTHSSDFPQDQMLFLRERLMCVDESRWPLISALQFKNPMTSLLLSLFLGGLGIDRFYIGDTGQGIGKLLTGGGCGIWTIIDWFLIQKATREKNLQMIYAYL